MKRKFLNEIIIPTGSITILSLSHVILLFVFKDLIEHPLAEEQTRRQKARGLWTQKKTSKLCAT